MIAITINGTEYQVPATLHEITLWQRIEFDKKYGKGLKEQLEAITKMPAGPVKELEFTYYHCELAIKTISFFGDVPIDILENTQVDDVLLVYHQTMEGFAQDVDFASKEFELIREFAWADETWVIAPPELDYKNQMTFGEFLDAKQWVKQLYEIGQDKWESLLMLACVYFRKIGEPYGDDMQYEDSERHTLLKKLPLDYALHVGFFLSGSMSSYLKISHSLQAVETP